MSSRNTPVTPPKMFETVRVPRSMARFARDETGGLMVFSLFIMVCMLLAVGISIDVMRFEALRTRIQNTSDAAVLAAADLDQTLTPEEVVTDYFTRAGIPAALGQITATSTDSSREVKVETVVKRGNLFLNLVGIDLLQGTANATAFESIEDIEIAMVLDVSNSMHGNSHDPDFKYEDTGSGADTPTTRIQALKQAAIGFTRTVLSTPTADRTSITLVPYGGSVNPGETAYQYLGVNHQWDLGGKCKEIQAEDYDHTQLPFAGDDQVPHFQYWSYKGDPSVWGWCPSEKSSIQYQQGDQDTLVEYIKEMTLHDGTGTPIAMKYGLALLDPGSRPLISTLAAKGEVPSRFADRPKAWGASGSVKYMVLMTDGGITFQDRPNDPEDPELLTKLVKNTTDGKYRRTDYNTNVASFLKQCELAKALDVTVFTIAFNAPAKAQTQMKQCASSEALYFEVTGLDIAAAFESIAAQINHLRLTN